MTTYLLYNNTVELVFDEEKHLYTVNGSKVDGTTGVLGVINKPALIPWAVKMCAEHLESVIKPGQVYDEIQLKEFLTDAKAAHRRRTKAAAGIGTLVHDWCKDWIAGKNPDRPINKEANVAIDKFLTWVKEKNVSFIESERIVYSQKLGYAGTLDFIAEIDKKTVLGDFKTSSGIWDEYFLQVAAYQRAWLEEFPEKHIDKTMIVRIGKEHGEIELQERDNVDYEKNKAGFVSALILYRRLEELKDEAYKKKQAERLLL